MRTFISIASCILVLTAIAGSGSAPQVSTDELTASLMEAVVGVKVDNPDGRAIRLLPDGNDDALLTRERIGVCIETVSEAGGWPEPWLIVQDASHPFDLILLLRLDNVGKRLEAVTVFAADRREWDAGSLKTAVKETTGKRPAAKIRNLVIQGFSSREVTEYVYETPAVGDEARGLMALLPEGSILREAVTVDLGDGHIHTLAVALLEPRFVPADCASCRGELFGHADTGGVLVALAGERELEDRLDVSSRLRGHDGEPLVPRYECQPRDGEDRIDEETVRRWFSERRKVRILRMEDLDGDGRSLEFSLPAGFTDCETHTTLTIAVDPSTASLRILNAP